MFVLAIDHRASFLAWSRNVTGTDVAAATLADLKLVVATALAGALEVAAPGQLSATEVGLLCEPGYGSPAIELARRSGALVILPVERSGQPEFIFEHGDAGFAAEIERAAPDAVKALVRYNPELEDHNSRSRARLARLGQYCQANGVPFMLEVLVPPGPGAGEDFDTADRPALTLAAIGELSAIGLRPDWWKLEAQPSAKESAAVAATAGATGDPGAPTCLVLGRAAPMSVVAEWVREAAGVAGYSGFAVGRTLWAEPLAGVLRGELGREQAAGEIASGYLGLVSAFRSGSG